jgi:mannitol operon transcriptional antiterminator
MNRRVCALLDILLEQRGQELDLKVLADRLAVSVRTIRNYWHSILEFWAAHQLSFLFTARGGTLRFDGTAHQARSMRLILANVDFYRYRLSPAERKTLIFFLLLCEDQALTLAQMETPLFVSRGTLIADLKTVRETLRTYNIDLREDKSKGFQITTSESLRRSTLLSTILEIGNPVNLPAQGTAANVILGFIARYLRVNKYRARAQKSIRATENYLQVTMSDIDFYDLVLALCIARYRHEKGCYIEAGFTGPTAAGNIAASFAEIACQNLYQDTRVEESSHIAQLVATKYLYPAGNFGQVPHNQFQAAVREFLRHLGLAYKIDFLDDEQLLQFLAGHMQGVYHRLKDNRRLQNPLKDQLIRDYPQDYKIVQNNIFHLEQALGHKMSADEVSYILMHIIAAIVRGAKSAPVPQVVIACNSGMGTANFLAEMVRKNLHVNVAAITSTHNLDRVLQKYRCDLILSTIPLQETTVPWIQVSPVLSRQDVKQVRQFLPSFTLQYAHAFDGITTPPMVEREDNRVDQTEQEADHSHFTALLLPDGVQLDRHVVDWREAIISAGEPMLWAGKITVEYMRAMVETVNENGPYIVFTPGVALAHAHPNNGVLGPSASFLRLNRPICFGHSENDPVRYVIAIGLPEGTYQIDLLLRIMNIMADPDTLARLDHASTAADVVDILRQGEEARIRPL